MGISGRSSAVALAAAVPLLLAGCQEDRRIAVRDLGKQIEFAVEDAGGERNGCIWSLTVFEEKKQDKPVWTAGLDENAECRSSITAPGPTQGYTAEGSPRFDGAGSYVVQAFGPGFNVTRTFKRSEL